MAPQMPENLDMGRALRRPRRLALTLRGYTASKKVSDNKFDRTGPKTTGSHLVIALLTALLPPIQEMATDRPDGQQLLEAVTPPPSSVVPFHATKPLKEARIVGSAQRP